MYIKDTALPSALGFASLGYDVFPINGVIERDGKLVCTCGNPKCASQGKHPYARLAPNGFKNATTDTAVIKTWPKGLNYGLDAAPFLIVDVDPRNGGDKTWPDLYRRPTRHVPHTWQVNTGGGGEHVFFRNLDSIAGCDLGKGVEIKAAGGYVVGVGCRHISGKFYQWAPGCSPDKAPLADPPQWLLDELSNKQPAPGERKPAEHWGELLEAGFVNGNRNLGYREIIGHLLGCGVDPQIAWYAIRCINLCAPDPEDTEKVEQLFNRIMARECAKRGL